MYIIIKIIILLITKGVRGETQNKQGDVENKKPISGRIITLVDGNRRTKVIQLGFPERNRISRDIICSVRSWWLGRRKIRQVLVGDEVYYVYVPDIETSSSMDFHVHPFCPYLLFAY